VLFSELSAIDILGRDDLMFKLPYIVNRNSN